MSRFSLLVVAVVCFLIPVETVKAQQTADWIVQTWPPSCGGQVGASGTAMFGNVPAEGPFSEVATAPAELNFEYPGHTLTLPVPVYGDGSPADLSELFFCIIILGLDWFEGTWHHFGVSHQPGSGILVCNVLDGCDEAFVEVHVFAARPLATSIPDGSRVPATLGTVKALLGEAGQ